MKKYQQEDRHASPYTLGYRLRLLAWVLVQNSIFITPKFMSSWRCFLLRSFGCKISGRPFVSGWSKIKAPWNLSLADRSCIGPHAEIYNIDFVEIKTSAVIAQYAYLCCGSHDFEDPQWPLITAPISIGEDAFVAAKSIVLMGVKVGDFAVIGAGAVVAKDVPAEAICVGNPAKFIGKRKRYAN